MDGRLVSAKRQKNQKVLAFMLEEEGETRPTSTQGTEALTTEHGNKGPAESEALMEEVCGEKNYHSIKFFTDELRLPLLEPT